MNYGIISLVLLLWACTTMCLCDFQIGPDPWHSDKLKLPANIDENNLPPDLRTPLKKEKQTETKFGFGEWWFKRLLAIILRSGQVKKSEDGSIDISLQMRFDKDKWAVLDECLKSDSTVSDVTFRRTVGYVEEAIYKPTITEQIVMAWSDYIQVYLIEYKDYLTWFFGILAAVGVLMWFWKHVSHKHVIVIAFVFLYMYEVFISYKEAEQQEFDKFVSAMNRCKWYFWTSECDLPSPDPIAFMKHMNPIKIGIRMFTSLISEPILAINATIKLSLQDLTAGLWFPFDKIVYGILIVVINISLVYLLVMIVFNFIFNLPFNFSFLGIFSIGIPRQNGRSLFPTKSNEHQAPQQLNGSTDRISNETLNNILNVCKLALTNGQHRQQSDRNMRLTSNTTSLPKLTRSASTGRLSALCSIENNNDKLIRNDNLLRKRKNGGGGGDGDN